ncbi:MAG: hypothetical protein ACM3NF_09085 [Gemmatimonadota bacterium]
MIRNAFLKKVEARLEALDDEIDRIVAKAEKAGADARIRYDEEIAALRMKREAARAKIREVRDAGGAGWGTLRGGVQDALDDLKTAIEQAIDRLRKSA